MNEQRKEAPDSKVSLARSAWSAKESVDELKKMNILLERIARSLEKKTGNAPEKSSMSFDEEPPF